jgi:ubiquinone/menaquinone biosynthesis C-methylase UbiE
MTESRPPRGDAPSPDLIMETFLGYQRAAALQAAVRLDLFTAIAEGAVEPASLAIRCAASARGLRILCDYLTVLGFLEKNGGAYRLGSTAATFLDRRSPSYLGSVGEFLLDPAMAALFLADPAAPVRNGGSEGLANLAPENPVWVRFARAMAPFVGRQAQMLAALLADGPHPRKVLDIAAGHGLFGIAVAEAFPSAEVVALDWAPVLEVARENAAAAGVGGRHRLLAGSAFEVACGCGFDVVLLPNFLHHFDAPACTALLKKVRAALTDDGRIAIVEFVPNDDRVSPPLPAMFAYVMLATTPAGDAYTFAEFERMLREAGFTRIERRPLDPTPQSAIIAAP